MMAAYRMEQGRGLHSLLEGWGDLRDAADVDITGLAMDSRRIVPGDLFLAVSGTRGHGLDHLDEALQRGAAAVAWEPADGVDRPDLDIPVVAVAGLSRLAGAIADRFYHHPSQRLTVVGITGTDGKTSCSHFLSQALHQDGAACGVIGTLGNGLFGELEASTHTTPDPVTLHALLHDMASRGARRVVMEVSSHGLDQGRVSGVAFDVALFTNLGRDHLDYHGDVESYGAAKARLFRAEGLRHAVINADDAFGRRLLADLPDGVEGIACCLDPNRCPPGEAHLVWGKELRQKASGMDLDVHTDWGQGHLHSRLLGRFNAENLLGVLGVLLALDIPLPEALRRLAHTRTVPGRMERFHGGPELPVAVVDYAHTPGALEQALTAVRAHCTGQVWCVFGCGGDRDRGKRPLMGAIAERLADRVVVTDDNPRHEDPEGIVQDILAGMDDPRAAVVLRDRAAAIALALEQAGAGDMVLVAGKGHETWQLVGDERLPFSDRRLVAEFFGEVVS
jgi:UDP-N-acetylmuramoyl-L-alanyl-D-glutamate--2,6-diaminopimelate ligase